jgi:hypothetical protein
MDRMSQFHVTSYHIHFHQAGYQEYHITFVYGRCLDQIYPYRCFVIFPSFQANARIIPQLGHYLFFSNPFQFTNHHVTETI